MHTFDKGKGVNHSYYYQLRVEHDPASLAETWLMLVLSSALHLANLRFSTG